MSQDSKTATRAAPAAPSRKKAAPTSRNAALSAPTNPGTPGGAAKVTRPAMARQIAATKPPTNSRSSGSSDHTVTTPDRRHKTAPASRAQTTLPAVGVALVLLTLVTALALGVADSAIAGADRTPDERRVAASTAAHLVSADGPLTDRANVLSGTRVAAFDGARLLDTTPATADYDVVVRLDGAPIAATGDDGRAPPATASRVSAGPTDGGTTIRRLVLVARTDTRTVEPERRRVTLPRRATNATVTFTPDNGTAVRTLRVNGRVRLHNESGLRGTHELRLTPYETATFGFQTVGNVSKGSVQVRYETPRTTKATLAVTVDA